MPQVQRAWSTCGHLPEPHAYPHSVLRVTLKKANVSELVNETMRRGNRHFAQVRARNQNVMESGAYKPASDQVGEHLVLRV